MIPEGLTEARPKGQVLSAQDETARGLWEAMQVRLSGVVAACNQHWFRAAEGWSYDGRTLALVVPSREHSDWLRSDLYRERLSRAASEVNRAGLRFRFLVVVPETANTVHNGSVR